MKRHRCAKICAHQQLGYSFPDSCLQADVSARRQFFSRPRRSIWPMSISHLLSKASITRLQQYYDPVRLPHRAARPSLTSRAATPRPEWASPVTRPTFPTCRAHYPGGSDRCMCRLLPCLCCLPRYSGGSASASSLSRPAQASLTLRPAGLLNRPWRPLSRGFDPASYPAKSLVSYQTYRQLSGWILPPLVKRAIGAHRIIRARLSRAPLTDQKPIPTPKAAPTPVTAEWPTLARN